MLFVNFFTVVYQRFLITVLQDVNYFKSLIVVKELEFFVQFKYGFPFDRP